MNDINNDLGMIIPKGAGVAADEAAKKLVLEHGFDILKKYAKLNFKNTEKVKELTK